MSHPSTAHPYIRSGLTLVEVLAATVLLALLAVAVVPLIRDTGRSVADSPPEGEMGQLLELGEIADRVLADPTRYGLAQVDQPEPMALTELRYPKNEAGPRIVVSRLESGGADHAWLAFRTDTAEVFRSVALAVRPASPSSRGVK